MSESEIFATATLEKRKTDLGTSPRVVRLIPRRAGSISSLYRAKTNLKAKKTLFATSKKKSCIKNGLSSTSVLAIYRLLKNTIKLIHTLKTITID